MFEMLSRWFQQLADSAATIDDLISFMTGG